MVELFDVVIVGGSVAGTSTALALQQHGITNILILERGDYEGDRLGESLPPNVRADFERLQIADEFDGQNHERCFGSCSIWGQVEPGYNDFLLNPFGHGWHLDRRAFNRLLAALALKRGAQLRKRTHYRRAQMLSNGSVRLHLSSPDQFAHSIDARFVVDASGHAGRFAAGRGARQQRLDQLVFTAAYFKLPDSHEFPRLTMLEAVEDGWWYAALLPGRRAVVNYATDRDTIRQRQFHLKSGIVSALAETRLISPLLADGQLEPRSLSACALPIFRLDDPVGENWIAVGDAASTFDPLSSQGMHKAMVDGREASQVIAARLSGKGDRREAYRAYVAKNFEDFLQNRNYFYAQEQRWPDSMFWNNRLPTDSRDGSPHRMDAAMR